MGELGKIIITTGFEKLPKVQKSPNLVALFMCNMHGGQYLGLSNMSNKVNLKICPKIEKVVFTRKCKIWRPLFKNCDFRPFKSSPTGLSRQIWSYVR